MANPDLSTLSTAFVKFGGEVFMKNVNEADFMLTKDGIAVYKNVQQPMPLPKLSAVGNPRPYRSQDDTSGNGMKWTDRTLTVNQSKWDMDFDPEEHRNKYLNDGTIDPAKMPFWKYCVDQFSKEYLAQINDNAAYLGSYNASGSTAAAIATGWGTIIAAEITATNLTAVVTGAVTSSNAVEKVELVVKDAQVKPWMRKKGIIVYVSFATFDKFVERYRTLNGYQYMPSVNGEYKIDGVNAVLKPVSWMGTSSRIIATVAGNLTVGVDKDNVMVAATARRNIIEARPMFPVGFQIADLDAIVVNDQA